MNRPIERAPRAQSAGPAMQRRIDVGGNPYRKKDISRDGTRFNTSTGEVSGEAND